MIEVEKEIIIKDVIVDFSEYYSSNNVSKCTQDKLNSTDILAVPTAYKNKEYYFAQETIDFIKYCRENTQEYSFDILSDDDIQVRSLHSFDIWMPIIWVASNVILPIAINMVSSYINEKLKGRETEGAKVDVTFLVKSSTEEKSIHYSGDAKTFKKSFEKIDLNKM